jgi:cytochrome c oxidase assembly protein subunit 15
VFFAAMSVVIYSYRNKPDFKGKDTTMTTSESHPWLHRYAMFVAFCTFLLVIAGALVTGNDAGLSVPSWPTSLAGQTGFSTTGIFHMPPMVGGIESEHSHRMLAGIVGFLTILLAIWVWRRDSRRWVRWVGFAAVMSVLAQAALGGITVLWFLPVAISAAHATLAQIFFCLAASLAFFTGADWRWDEAKLDDRSTPSLQQLTAITTCVILGQLMLGAVYRHSQGGSIVPHVVGACVVTLLVGWVVSTVVVRFAKHPHLLHPALLLGGVLVAQLLLGVGSYVMKMGAQGAPQPLAPMVDVTTTHVAVGALLLVTSLYLTYQAHRFLASPRHQVDMGAVPHQART